MEQILRERLKFLSKTQRRVAEFMLEHAQEMMFLSLKEAANRGQVSEVTILNVCKQLGFPSYIALREAFRRTVLDTAPYCRRIAELSQKTGKMEDGEEKSFLEFVLAQHSNYLNSVFENPSKCYSECANIIMEAEQVYILGHDASKIPADYLAHRLQFLKISASSYQIGASDSIHALLAKLNANDVMVFISLKDYHQPSQEIARFAQSKGAKIIVITDSLDSPVVTDNSFNLLCRAQVPLIFNSMSTPISVIELLTARIAVTMGDRLDQITHEFLMVHQYLSEHSAKEK